jgi:tyrosinase
MGGNLVTADVSPPIGTEQVAAGTVGRLPPPAVRVRPNIEQSNIAALSAGYAKMQARTESDNRSWVYWAEFHGFNRFDCWHHGSQGNHSYPYDLFLPWHRAYLLYFEFVVFADDAGGAALPWWDWTSALSHQNGIPASFAAAQVGGQPNPLASGPVPTSLRKNPPRTTRSPGPPGQLPSAQTINGILGLTSFEDFSNQVQNQHDLIHGWTRGDMGVIATSAFDPIFWSHHCMIDRLWYLWQLKHGVDNIPPGYLNEILAPWHVTVKDVLSVTALGYTYGVSRVRLPFQNLTTAAL